MEPVIAAESALSNTPDDPVALHNYGVAFRALGQLEESAQFYRRSLDAEPGNVDTVCALANVLRQMDRNEEAIRLYIKCIDRDPQNINSYNNSTEKC